MFFSPPGRKRRAQGSRSARTPLSYSYAENASPRSVRQDPIGERRRAAVAYEDSDGNDDDENDIDLDEADDEYAEEDEEERGNDDDDVDGDPQLLPLFEASHLDSLPVYNLTHALRFLIVPRCETTLSWDQLRSPQVSQFLVKPIQRDILTSHFSRATLYALLTNCLQFTKEASTNPGNSGTSKTRAMVSELLAIKLLKEYTTRELIDALSYDFFPLQGLEEEKYNLVAPPSNGVHALAHPRTARISTLEIAIRTQAKRFLAHPVVVQQLEAIWAGSIIFHSAADSMHRRPSKVGLSQSRTYGTTEANGSLLVTSQDATQSMKQRERSGSMQVATRRTVTLYNPRDASLFKLSRLRVPRYRQFLSTCSLAVLLSLFVAVLSQRSTKITMLEMVFWFWSAGFMLDEVVGFNDQGFSLYIMSFWNSFDLGILFILICYYCLRLVGLVLPDVNKARVAQMAYDILAINAILLFPRLFSVLDHYRYFSQLLIAFRMMLIDLIAILILIIIACSGFFVALTLSFGNDSFKGYNVAYALFQILVGYTPAAWDEWDNYNFLGRTALVIFILIAHFLVITILITVLTNSFMAIAQNANDEHQFVFAVNTISMVKSDALFSYVAPTNIIAWLLSPLRHFTTFRTFVWVNRTVIKATHFPVLFAITAYERIFLARSLFEPTDLITQMGQAGPQLIAFELGSAHGGVSPGPGRLPKEQSVANFHQNRALDEVFRQTVDESAGLPRPSQRQKKASHVVNNWMQGLGPEGQASPPVEQDDKLLARLERPRQRLPHPPVRKSKSRAITSATRSVASDPEEFVGSVDFTNARPHRRPFNPIFLQSMDDVVQSTDAGGEDDLVGQDADGARASHADRGDRRPVTGYFAPLPLLRSELRQPISSGAGGSSTQRGTEPHDRTKTAEQAGSNAVSPSPTRPKLPKRHTTTIRARPVMPPRTDSLNTLDSPNRARNRSSMALDLASDLGDNKAVGGGLVGAIPASFETHMARARGGLGGVVQLRGTEGLEDQQRMSKLMLVRMNTLEAGFKEVLKEVKDWRSAGGDSVRASGTGSGTVSGAASATEMGSSISTVKRAKAKEVKLRARALGKKRQEKQEHVDEWIDEEDLDRARKGD